MGKAQPRKNELDRVNNLGVEKRKLYGIMRKNRAGGGTASTGLSSGGGVGGNTGSTNSQGYLPVGGGAMKGAIAFNSKQNTLMLSTNVLDVTNTGNNYSTYVQMATGTYTIKTIQGAHDDGQVLILQANGSITVDNTGNILPINTSATNTWNDQDSSIFIFDPTASINGKWRQIVSGATSGGGSFLPLSGGTMTGSINMGNKNITNLAKEEFTSGTTVTAGQFGISVPASFLTFNAVNPSTDGFAWTFANTEKFHMSSSAIYPTVNHIGDLGISSTNEFGNIFVQGVNISGLLGFVGTIGSTGWATDCYPHNDGGANLGHISGTLARWANCFLAGTFYNYEAGSPNKYLQIVKNTSDHYVYYNCNDTVTGIGHLFQKNGGGFLAVLEDDGLFWGMVEHQSVTTLTTGSHSLGNQYGVIFCDCSGGSVTLNLPAMAGFNGRTYRFIKTDASGNSVIVNRSSTDTINGATSLSWNTQYQAKNLIANGSGLWGVF